MATLTIFTPAYNRAHTIGRTYESLLRQSCKDFEWLIVDDGSSDNTRELAEGWISENKIKIRYIHQSNQGMHGAHNTAYANISTELNTCIDSDDYMPDDAVEKIIGFWQRQPQESRRKYAGIIGLDQNTENKIIGTEFKDSTVRIWEFYAKGGRGDKKMVYRTEVVKKYPPYPIFENEKYVGLGALYFRIDQDYELLTLNEPLVTVDYQDDGSSRNMYRQYVRNPQGFIYLRKLILSSNGLPMKLYMRHGIHYVAEKYIAKEGKSIIKDSPRPFLCAVLLLPGYALYRLIRNKAMNGDTFKIKS